MATVTASRGSTATTAAQIGGPVATVAVVGLAWAVALPRLVPGTAGDHGTYVSVAERLLAGDRLYVDVWDNKDPLFYYLLAAGRLVSPLADVALEVLWVVLTCAAVHSLARAAAVPRALSVVAAFGGVPLLLTGAAYEAGMTHLPGIALTLASVALAVRGRWVATGVLVGLLVLTKLMLAPVAVGALAVVAIHRSDPRGGLRAGVAAVATALVGVAALGLCGELAAWLDLFRLNVAYADGALASSQYGSVAGHLLRAFPEDGRGAGLVTVVAIVLVLLLVRRSTAPSDGGMPQAALWDATCVTLLVGLGVIALTATWPHHLQMLYVPGALAIVLTAARLGQSARDWRPVVVVGLAAYVIGGALHPYGYLQSARSVGADLEALQTRSPESTVLAHLPVHSYARAGMNDVTGHAMGLGDLRLACPRFTQYHFDDPATLDAVARCLPTADAVIVDDTLHPEPDALAWNAYVARVRALVATGYDCVPTTASQVCLKQRP